MLLLEPLRLLVLPVALAGVAHAHEFTITPVSLVLAGDGSFQVEVGLDVDALALGLPLETDSAIVSEGMRALSSEDLERAVEAARFSIQEDFRIQFDEQSVSLDVAFPHWGTPAVTEADPPTVLGTAARLTGDVPSGARWVSVQLPSRYKTVSVQVLTPQGPETQTAVLDPGEASPRFSLAGDAGNTSAQGVFLAYTGLGFAHILPKGLDHILFVLGLFLLSTRWRPLLYQVTAFTVAHSATLALSMQGIVSLPERLVETFIALSISWVAVENVVTSTLQPWRVALVFCFGLLHGLGFAGVLRELGLPEGHFLASLVAFNVGVELGQLTVVALALVLVGRFRSHPRYRQRVVLPCSAAIAATGLWWAVTRAFG